MFDLFAVNMIVIEGLKHMCRIYGTKQWRTWRLVDALWRKQWNQPFQFWILPISLILV